MHNQPTEKNYSIPTNPVFETPVLRDASGLLTKEGFLFSLRSPVTELGCYPIAFLMSDGETMSFDYALKNKEQICDAIDEKSKCGWQAVDCFVNWESTLYCCGTGKQIASAYDPIDGE